METIKIRRMEPEDAPEVSCMERQIFSQPWSCQGFLDALALENAIFLVAESSGKILGYCGMYCAADEGEITNVAVDEAHRNCGIGKMLVQQLLKEAKEVGIAVAILEVRISNESAIHLYEAMGFTIQGIRKGFYEMPKEDGYVMTLSQ